MTTSRATDDQAGPGTGIRACFALRNALKKHPHPFPADDVFYEPLAFLIQIHCQPLHAVTGTAGAGHRRARSRHLPLRPPVTNRDTVLVSQADVEAPAALPVSAAAAARAMPGDSSILLVGNGHGSCPVVKVGGLPGFPAVGVRCRPWGVGVLRPRRFRVRRAFRWRGVVRRGIPAATGFPAAA
jgi:hypothetical protein